MLRRNVLKGAALSVVTVAGGARAQGGRGVSILYPAFTSATGARWPLRFDLGPALQSVLKKTVVSSAEQPRRVMPAAALFAREEAAALEEYQQFMRGPRDGTSLAFVDSAVTSALPVLRRHAWGSVLQDAVPVCRVAVMPAALAIHPAVPATNLQELMALVHASPERYSALTDGVMAPGHLLAMQWRKEAGIPLRLHHPPDSLFRSTYSARGNGYEGRYPLIFAAFHDIGSFARTGAIHLLAVTGGSRMNNSLVDVPTFAEAGFPDSGDPFSCGLLAPPGTSLSDVENLSAKVKVAVNDRSYKETESRRGTYRTHVSGPQEYAEEVRAQRQRFSMLVE